MSKITPFLWFDDQAEEAAKFYVSIFKNSKITHTSYYSEATEQVSGKAGGSVMVVLFELDGQQFSALNGGPQYKHSPAISFSVPCESQQEIDLYWEKLLEGGEAQQCGWLADKYGISWQIVPKDIGALLSGPDPEKNKRAMNALLQMKKIDTDVLKRA